MQQKWMDGVALHTQSGQYLIGRFTADATSQTMAIGGSGIFRAVQVRAFLASATLGLVAIFGGGLLFIRRRFMI